MKTSCGCGWTRTNKRQDNWVEEERLKEEAENYLRPSKNNNKLWIPLTLSYSCNLIHWFSPLPNPPTTQSPSRIWKRWAFNLCSQTRPTSSRRAAPANHCPRLARSRFYTFQRSQSTIWCFSTETRRTWVSPTTSCHKYNWISRWTSLPKNTLATAFTIRFNRQLKSSSKMRKWCTIFSLSSWKSNRSIFSCLAGPWAVDQPSTSATSTTPTVSFLCLPSLQSGMSQDISSETSLASSLSRNALSIRTKLNTPSVLSWLFMANRTILCLMNKAKNCLKTVRVKTKD